MVAFLFCFLFCFVFVLRTQRLCKKTMAHVFCLEKKNNENLQQAGNCTHICVGRIWDSFFRLFVLSGSSDAKQPILNLPIHHLILIENQNRQKFVTITVYFYQRSHFLNKLIFRDFGIHRFRIGYLIQRTRYVMFCFGTY